MSKSIIQSSQAPAAVGPYSHAVQSGPFLFCSGQIPLDPVTGQLVTGDIQAQTVRVLENLRAVLNAANLGFEQVVKTTVFLTDLQEFAAMNEVYGRYFSRAWPARSTVQVSGLPKGARVEIELIAGCPTT
jgi:2-iminobutanoate/2-iminopropanoate deaminase